MIDTVMLKLRLDRQQRENAFGAVNNLVRESGSTKYLYFDKKHGNTWQRLCRTKAFASGGIKEIALIDCCYPGNTVSYIIITCKPARVLHMGDAYALSSFGDYVQTVELINNFIMDLNVHMGVYALPFLNEWTVGRIDYAFQFPTKEYGLYLMFLRKGCSYKEDKYADSVYIPNSKSTVNFYDKTAERKLEDSCHTLRFEVQCYADYLYKMLYDGRIANLKLRELWNEKLALSIVTKRIGKLIGYGDFYSIDSAETVLRETSRVSEYEIKALRQLLGLSLYPSVRRESQWNLFAVRNEKDDADGKVKERLTRILKRAGVNQMAIPVRRRVEMLKNPVRIILESLQVPE